MNQPGANQPSLGSLAIAAPRGFVNYLGRHLLNFISTIHGLGAFTLITLGVMITKFRTARGAVHPLIHRQIFDSGLRLLPMVGFLSMALGVVIIGQTVALLQSVGAQEYAGTVMVTIVVRELGPVLTALLVLARVGTATVIELGTTRAMGEVEALESMGIDPIHYLVVPRVLGISISIFTLTIYAILTALASGYLFIFLQDIPLTPGDYVKQLVTALLWQDFVMLGLKTVSFGTAIALVTCYQGLARPLRLQEVSAATTRAVVHSVVWCVLLDACFIVVYLLM